MPDKIPCEYEWLNEYNDEATVSAERDGDLVLIKIEGAGDGTLELAFCWRNFLGFTEQLFELHNEVCKLIDNALDAADAAELEEVA